MPRKAAHEHGLGQRAQLEGIGRGEQVDRRAHVAGRGRLRPLGDERRHGEADLNPVDARPEPEVGVLRAAAPASRRGARPSSPPCKPCARGGAGARAGRGSARRGRGRGVRIPIGNLLGVAPRDDAEPQPAVSGSAAQAYVICRTPDGTDARCASGAIAGGSAVMAVYFVEGGLRSASSSWMVTGVCAGASAASSSSLTASP